MSNTDTDFATDWLACRFPHDNAARNGRVEQACLDATAPFAPLRIVDLGAGTGASCLYFLEKFPQEQHWTLVELNPELIAAGRKRLSAWAEEKGYVCENEGDQLRIRIRENDHRITFRQASFLEPENLPELAAAHLATANAVFDLLSPAMCRELAMFLHQNQTALLATLNYADMRFAPTHLLDEAVTAWYEAHMQRPRDFGAALGPAGTMELLSLYESLGAPVVSGESWWRTGPAPDCLQDHLLDYIEKSVPEMIPHPAEREAFQKWLERKRKEAREGRLRIEVGHYDLFVNDPPRVASNPPASRPT